MKKIAGVLVLLTLMFALTGCDSSDYKKATKLYEAGEYKEASQIFLALNDYKNSQEMLHACKYSEAAALYSEKNYADALAVFETIADFQNSADMILACKYGMASDLHAAGDYKGAMAVFETISGYQDSAEMISACKFGMANDLYEAEDYEGTAALLEEIGDFPGAEDLADKTAKALMRLTYGDVMDALDGNFWYFNGGSDTVLNRIQFSGDNAEITQAYFDGNGRHENGTNSYSYIIDGQTITVKMSGDAEMEIPYKMDGAALSFGNGEYLTEEEVDAGLQGYWKLRYSENLLGRLSTSEHNIYIHDGKLKAESANPGWNLPRGQYYYYGPDEGEYTLGFGCFNTRMNHGIEWFFNIIDGKPVPLHYDRACVPGDKLPGQYGYSF